MRRILPLLGIAGLVAAGCSDPATAPAVKHPSMPSLSVSGSESRWTGNHLVFFNSNSIPAGFARRVMELQGSLEEQYGSIGIAVVSGLSETAAAELAGDEGVSSVDPDGEFQFELPAVVAPEAADAVIQSPDAPHTATFFPRQWHLRAIHANDAWAAGYRGSSSVRVAILDTGIDYLHRDLAGRVDLANSASFVPSDDAIVAAMFPGRHPVTDLHFHGTHVAATVSSNAFAAAGVTSQTTLMGVKVLSRTGSGSTSGLLAGIVYATDHGADVINMSLAVTALLNGKAPAIKAFEKATDRVFQYAHAQGVTIIVAAGNEAQDLDTKFAFKAHCNSVHVTCVSATGPTAAAGVNGPWTNIDASAGYTNFGVKDIDVAAPGGNTGGAVWAACSGASLAIPICRTGTFVLGVSGTSMAAPHTAGVAALILGQQGDLRPGVVRSILENTADDLGDPGTDARYGRGRINAAAALGL